MHHQLPSLSSSVSSNSSLSSPSSPTGPSASSEPQQQQQQRRQGLPPQRSASAGALMRQQQQQQQQHHHHHHHTAAVFRHSCHAPLRPASWIDDERRISFTQQNQGIVQPHHHHHQHTPSIATTLQLPIVQPLEPLSPTNTESPSSQRHTMLWDESQLAMELAEDDLMDDTHIKRRRSARRIKEKLMSTIIPQQQDLANSMPNDRDMQAVSPTTSNRIARSLKKLTGFIF
ncbi:hypothetical protein O0I10_004742 [Lichtheimia ornata]|uniref:Uncharacterized protein n=1 Tax=Lichtheimia ornata TaxID=688661 RepID=A0AAD7V5U6_9FUNG|nr:uncharacterized protein O0I10_004742 [Lichtheimia ornata]KAJ8659380.1 hypothetical protein O0I10_004742 [Lichtheimia ornata]